MLPFGQLEARHARPLVNESVALLGQRTSGVCFCLRGHTVIRIYVRSVLRAFGLTTETVRLAHLQHPSLSSEAPKIKVITECAIAISGMIGVSARCLRFRICLKRFIKVTSQAVSKIGSNDLAFCMQAQGAWAH